jgi:hypothetical protein
MKAPSTFDSAASSYRFRVDMSDDVELRLDNHCRYCGLTRLAQAQSHIAMCQSQ